MSTPTPSETTAWGVVLPGATICAYAVDHETRIEAARQKDGRVLWAVRRHGACLARDGEWDWEPSPSGRDDAFLQRFRFASPHEALDVAKACLALEESQRRPPVAAAARGQ